MKNFNDLITIISKDYYPLVYIPTKLSTSIVDKKFYEIDDNVIIKEYSLKAPIRPDQPLKPKLPINFKNESYEKLKLENGFWNILIPVIAIFFSIGILSTASKYDNKTPIVLLIIGLTILIIIMFKLKTSSVTCFRQVPLTSYEKDKKYLEYKQTEKEYEFNMVNYSKLIEKYNNDLSNYRYKIEQNKQKNILKKYFEILNEASRPERCTKPSLKG